MKNFVNEGKTINYTNGGSAIVSGQVIPVTGVGCLVATKAIANGETQPALCEGVVTVAKAAGTYSQGAKLYWVAADSNVSTSPGSGGANVLLGVAWETSSGTTIKAKLTFGGKGAQAAVVAALAQTISGSYQQAEVQAISTKVDAILTALKNAGLMASA